MTDVVKTEPVEPSLDDLRVSRAAIDQKIAVAEQKADNHSHFHDADGNVIADADLTDAMLRATGIAMEKRAATIKWLTMDASALENAIQVAIQAKDYVGAALYAAALNAHTTIEGA